MVRLAVAAVLAGVLQFAWGFVFWAVSPMSHEMIGRLDDEDKVVKAIQESNPETGVYFLPYCDGSCMADPESEKSKAFTKRISDGPLVQVVYRKEGCEPMGASQMGTGFAHMVGGSFLAGVLLLMAAPGLRTYFSRLLFVAALGVFAAFAINLAQPIWFHHPWKYHLMASIHDVVAWSLAGVILAAFVRRAD